MIRVVLPAHLWTLARVGAEVQVDVPGTPTPAAVIEALEQKYPVLKGTIRDYGTLKRRPLVRYFVCAEDWSHDPPDRPLPQAIVDGTEPFYIIGAIAGG
jgi:hypothetical protein